MSKIYYCDGYKYQLEQDYSIQTSIRPERFIYTDFVRMDLDGMLYIRKGYAWDGPSGPAIDTKSMMRASLVHDALYQLISEGMLDFTWRDEADAELRLIYEEDVMVVASRDWPIIGTLRRLYARARGPSAEAAVRVFGESHAVTQRVVLIAP